MRDLFEIERQYHTRLVSQVEKYRGQGYWIHFGATSKLGVRPTEVFHGDPKGVYFYDLDWVMSHERFENGQQYGTNLPYWTIVKLNPNPAGVVMSKLDRQALDDLADKQQWSDFEAYNKKQNDNGVRNPNIFWRYVTRSRSTNANTLLRGIPYVLDDGTGSIHSYEPFQLVVFDPRSISIVSTGNQYSGRGMLAIDAAGKDSEARGKAQTAENFAHITNALLRELRGRYGGELQYKKNVPNLKITGPHSTFAIGPDTSRLYANDSYKMVARWGRAMKTIRLDYYKTTEMSMSSLVEFFSSVIDHIMTLGPRDLFFVPAIPVKAAEKIVKDVLPQGTIVTEIDNSSAHIDVTGTVNFSDSGLFLKTSVRAWITKKEVTWFVDGRIEQEKGRDGRFLSYRADELTDLSALRADMLEKTELHNPSADSYRKFYHQDEYEAFLGWLCINAGIPALLANKDWVAQYERADKTILMRSIARVYSRY